jgi:HTH-type transcriptional regulator / antitoxin HipB
MLQTGMVTRVVLIRNRVFSLKIRSPAYLHVHTQTRIYILCACAYYVSMDTVVRTPRQLGAGIRRYRRQKGLTQGGLGDLMSARQATVSKLESGEPATQLRIFMDALTALDLELVIRPRTKLSTQDIEELF